MPVLGGEMASQDICGRYGAAPEYMLPGPYMWEKHQGHQYSLPLNRIPPEESQCVNAVPTYTTHTGSSYYPNVNALDSGYYKMFGFLFQDCILS